MRVAVKRQQVQLTAHLRNQMDIATGAIDLEAGIIRGVRVIENGKVARFDKGKSFTVTPAHIQALRDHAGNRSIPVHWTHDYGTEGEDNLHAVVGSLCNFRIDASNGNLIADLKVAPTDKRALIMWNADHNREGMMLSIVFTHAKGDEMMMPTSFLAADLVESGAATTALLSKSTTQDDTDMTPDEIKKAIADGVKEALAAVETAKLSATAPDKEKTEAAALETAAGVTDADKKPEDANLSPMTAAHCRAVRATARLREATKGEVVTLAAAKLASGIGSGEVVLPTGGVGSKDLDTQWKEAVQAQLNAGAKDRNIAVMRAIKDKGELYNALRAAGKVVA